MVDRETLQRIEASCRSVRPANLLGCGKHWPTCRTRWPVDGELEGHSLALACLRGKLIAHCSLQQNHNLPYPRHKWKLLVAALSWSPSPVRHGSRGRACRAAPPIRRLLACSSAWSLRLETTAAMLMLACPSTAACHGPSNGCGYYVPLLSVVYSVAPM